MAEPTNRGPLTEAAVVAALVSRLQADGWEVTTEVNFVDVLAERTGERLLIEAKGHTSSPGLDVDTAYGQLLRRMDPTEAGTRYGLAVPVSVRPAAERVAPEIRRLLKIDIYLVGEDCSVTIGT